MKKVDVFEDENSISIEDEFQVTTIEVFSNVKRFTVDSSVKNDFFSNYFTYEYKISTDPVGIQVRLLEKSSEPPVPRKYEVKDGVVLESEIIKDKDGSISTSITDRISELKKMVKWVQVDILVSYELNLYILSKHPEIISGEEYRKFLRQTLERIKLGIVKVDDALKNDKYSLEINTSEYGKSIWCKNEERDEAEMDEYYNLSEDKRKKTKYNDKLEYIEKLNDSLFKESSSKYVGIDKNEFDSSQEVIEYLERKLDNKRVDETKKNKSPDKNPNNKIKWIIVIILSIIALSRGAWAAIGVFILGAIIINLLFSNKK